MATRPASSKVAKSPNVSRKRPSIASTSADDCKHIQVGGFLGIGERNVAIPLSDLQVDQNDRIIANVNRDNLRQMQPYRRGAYRAAEPARPLRDILGPK